MAENSAGKEKFFEDFGKRFDEVVLDIEMANIMASDVVLEKLGLFLPEGADSVWGLLVFCESKKVYFYVHASESMMSAMMRVAKQGEGPKEQYVCLSEVNGFKILERTKRWYDFMIPAIKFQIEAEIDGDNGKLLFDINTQKRAEDIRKKF